MKHNNVIAIYAHVVVVRTKNMTKLDAFFVKKQRCFQVHNCACSVSAARLLATSLKKAFLPYDVVFLMYVCYL